MGVFTDNMQQINRSIQTQNEQKITQKESKKNFENYIFFEIWQTFATSENIEKTYLYFKDTTTTKSYIEKHEHIKKRDSKYIYIIDFDNLTITEKLKIYNNILDKIYKQFKYKIKYKTYEETQEQQAAQEQEQKKEKHVNILDILGAFFLGLLIPTNTSAKKFKKYKF